MKKIEFKFRSTGNRVDIRAVKYVPDKKIIAILQIAHGMVEFIDRYDEFAKFLTSKGFLVVGNDHIGHGESVNSKDDWGYFGENGNKVLEDDIHLLTTIIKKEYPDLPYFLLGHSMGSFYARQYMSDYGNELDGCIVMGTGYQPLVVVKAGMAMCKMIALFKGWRHRSNFVNNMAFGSYNKQFEPVRTRADWLTKDEKIVDFYINEPKCSFLFTLNGYFNMFKGLSRLHDKKLLNKIPKKLPILLVSGSNDPVGSNGKEVKQVYDTYNELQLEDVNMKLYPNDRHEILNELDNKQVYEDIYSWLDSKIQ